MNCDRLARWYRWLEYGAFGRALERRRAAFLPCAQAASRVLLLGDGDGRFAARLLAQSWAKTLHVTSVDASAGMLELAGGRLQNGSAGNAGSARVEWIHADARIWLRECSRDVATGLRAPVDLIVTHFFLDCFTEQELPALIAAIGAAAATDARWLIAEFRQPPGRDLRAWHAAIWLWLLYAFFRLTTGLTVRRLPDHRPALLANGFRLVASENAHAGLLTSEYWVRGLESDPLSGQQEKRREHHDIRQDAAGLPR
jgi:SAM-dependent methyltransferase